MRHRITRPRVSKLINTVDQAPLYSSRAKVRAECEMPFPNRSESSEERDQYDISDSLGHSLNLNKSPAKSRTWNQLQKQQELMLHDATGEVFSTPPESRRRRHSRMHLRVSSEISVDQTGTSTNVAGKDRYRIVMIGSSSVGKTAIVDQFLYGSFPNSHAATVEELHKGEYEVPEIGLLPIEILDTSGSYEFPAMRRLAISKGDAFAIVYAIDDAESFEEVKRQREAILQVKGCENPPPIVVVGNKSDLPEDRRTIQLELAECECIDWDHGFVECSAKNNENIGTIFSSLLIQARLKGLLNKIQPATGRSQDEARHHNQRRRSSLPISELFHHRHTGSGLNPRTNNPIRKRNSCTPS